MKPLVCDLCGSNDVVKDGDVFVCQHCGTKYTVETAKQMMFGDGPVVVEVKNDAKIENLLGRAEDFLAFKEHDKAIEYCNRVLDIDRSNEDALALLEDAKFKKQIYWARRAARARNWTKALAHYESALTVRGSKEAEDVIAKIRARAGKPNVVISLEFGGTTNKLGISTSAPEADVIPIGTVSRKTLLGPGSDLELSLPAGSYILYRLRKGIQEELSPLTIDNELDVFKGTIRGTCCVWEITRYRLEVPEP